MNMTYGLIEEIYTTDADTRIAYGIVAYTDADKNETAVTATSVHDITANKQAMIDLVMRCNCLKLSPIHLTDVIEDFLTSEYLI